MPSHADRITITALSLGAGVQSTTLGLLAIDGHLPKPDVAIFADTGWEPAAVYAQVERIAVELEAAGIEFHRVSNGNLRRDAIDPEHRYASIPYFVQNQPGPCVECDATGIDKDGEKCKPCRGSGWDNGEGMGRRQCTSEYKLDPITRKIRELLGAKAPEFRRVPKGNVAEQWVGFSTDEVQRANRRRDSQGVKYLTTRYPLLDLGMSRTDCQKYLTQRGWGDTQKSACIGCPYHGNRQWRALRDTCRCGHVERAHRDDGGMCMSTISTGAAVNGLDYGQPCPCLGFSAPEWEDAVAFDADIRKGGARGLPLNGEAFLHRSRLPLSIAPIDKVTRAEAAEDYAAGQPSLLDLVEDGDPDGCSPYGCRSGEPT